MASTTFTSESSLAASKAAVLDTVRTFLACIVNNDPKLMHSLVLPNGTGCLMRPHLAAKAEQPMMMPLSKVIDRVFELYSEDERSDEQGFDEVVLLDEGSGGSIACVWCPYRFLKGKSLSHTGSNMFSLAKFEEKWLITGVADIARMA